MVSALMASEKVREKLIENPAQNDVSPVVAIVERAKTVWQPRFRVGKDCRETQPEGRGLIPWM